MDDLIMDTLIKHGIENLLYNFDFTDLLESGETILSVVSVTATTPAGALPLTIGAPVIGAGNLKVQARISGGTEGITYHLTCIVGTTLSSSPYNTREMCGDLVVQAC